MQLLHSMILISDSKSSVQYTIARFYLIETLSYENWILKSDTVAAREAPGTARDVRPARRLVLHPAGPYLRANVCVCVCVACVCVCVAEKESVWQKESVCVCGKERERVCVWQRQRVCVAERERERERESVCVALKQRVKQRERACVCVGERESVQRAISSFMRQGLI